MEWVQIREHYRRELAAARKHRGLTQKKVAEAGGLSAQNMVSKLLTNKHQGPSAEILVHAIEGLGLSVSEFFRRLEQQASGDQDAGRDVVLSGSYAMRTAIQEKPGVGKSFVIDTLIEALQRARADALPARRRKR